MRRVTWALIAAATVVAAGAVATRARAEGGAPTLQNQAEFQSEASRARRVPCTDVVSLAHKQIRISRGGLADISQIAKQLGTSVVWTEKCMLAYGLQAVRPGHETSEAREERLESFEEDEFEESGPEDVPEPGARERPEYPEKERQFRIKPAPTPRDFRQ